MAITKVAQYASVPTEANGVTDYQAQNAHLQAFINQSNGQKNILYQSAPTSVPVIKQGSYIAMGGTLYIVDTEDYAILGTPSVGDNYIVLAASGDNLTATWTQDVANFEFNNVYNIWMYNSMELLPYHMVYNNSSNYTNSPYGIGTIELNKITGDSSSSHVFSSESSGNVTSVTSEFMFTNIVGNAYCKMYTDVCSSATGSITITFYKNGTQIATATSSTVGIVIQYSAVQSITPSDVFKIVVSSDSTANSAGVAFSCNPNPINTIQDTIDNSKFIIG